MNFPIFLVDAFSRGPFTGNPAAVVFLEEEQDDRWLQNVATEMNQAETAFVVPSGSAYLLRWFTPTVEVDLCGHATLATAHVLYSSFGRSGTLEFLTRSGTLTAERWDEGIELDFPSEEPSRGPLPRELTFLKTPPLWTGNNRMDWFIQLDSLPELLDLKPNFDEIASLGKRGLIVTAHGDETVDFVSRCFFPQSGVNEDPVTGSSHCALAPFWEKRLGKSELTGLQASSRRGWVVVKNLDNRVKLRGASVMIVEGKLRA